MIKTTPKLYFLVSELPELLCRMSEKCALEQIKQIFAFVNQEKIPEEEMGIENNPVNQGKKPRLVDAKSVRAFYKQSVGISWAISLSPLMLAIRGGHL